VKHFSQDPCDLEFVQDPYRFYDQTRESGPAFFWSDYNLPCVTGFRETDALLRDRRLGRQNPEMRAPQEYGHIAPFMAFESHSLLELEAPDHTRIRGQLVRAFTNRRIMAFEAEIATLSNDLIDAFPDGPFDLLTAFAEKIPVIIIARLLGVPETMADQLLAWSHAMVAMYQANKTRATEEAAVAATLAFGTFMRDTIAKRRQDPNDDLIATVIAAGSLTEDELITTLILLLNAGHEATVHAIGNAVKTLLTLEGDPCKLTAPDQIEATVEETLRFDPPLHMFTRYVYEDVKIGPHVLKKGSEVGLLLGAANRDPTRFHKANHFNPARQDQANTSFGAGVHFCIGAPLARLELKIALGTLFARCPRLGLAKNPTVSDRYHFHGLERLMVLKEP